MSNTRRRQMKLRTVSGVVGLRVKIGYSQPQRRWVNPIRQSWALAPYQQVSPELQSRVCQTATRVPTCEGAVQAARCWGCEVSDDLIHRHVQDLGRKAAGLVLPLEKPPAREAAFSLVIMMDGWMARERFSQATLILDFHHAREQLMAVGEALHGNDSAALHAWVDPRLDQLQKGKEARVISQLEDLQQTQTLAPAEAVVVDRETRYYAEHRDHLHYQRWKRSGTPRGSGAVESLGLQLQRRFRTCGQFWKRAGLTNLLKLCVLHKNQDQRFLWN